MVRGDIGTDTSRRSSADLDQAFEERPRKSPSDPREPMDRAPLDEGRGGAEDRSTEVVDRSATDLCFAISAFSPANDSP
jgi:hypothetical protein